MQIEEQEICVESIYTEKDFSRRLLKELETFNMFIKEAGDRLKYAQDAETYPNEAIQDVLHVIELRPNDASNEDISHVLHDLREKRRIAKDELAVADMWNTYVAQHLSVFKLLPQLIGKIRQTLDYEPTRMYNMKTNIFGNKGEWISKEEEDAADDIHESTPDE